MKKYLLYTIVSLLSIVSFAQESAKEPEQASQKREEKIQALYIAYITQELKLTPDEAQKFWPVHAQYLTELKNINIDGKTDELAKQQAILNIKKKYQANFNKVLGSERCNSFYRKDGEFKKRMLERLKQMKQQRMEQRNNLQRRNKGASLP